MIEETKTTETTEQPKRAELVRNDFAYTVPQLTGRPFKRTKLYDLMKDGRLPYTVVGGQRIIPAAAYHSLLGLSA